MRFVHDVWLYAVLLLPLVWLGLRLADRRAAGRLRLLLGRRAAEHVEGANPRLRGWRRFFLLAGLFCLLLGLARPQWGASEVAVTQRGSDIVIALDISNSMLAEDVLPNRLERAKAELTAFLGRLDDSRIGLVFFAGSAFVQCPLTLDYGTAEIFLRMADPDMLSEQGTAIGAALETARGLLAKGRAGEQGGTFQAILLVTDGEDLEGAWEDAARACVRDGVRLIPVGVGEEGGGLIPVTNEQGRPSGFLKDDTGKVVMTRLDVASLEAMAALNAGSPFRIGVDGLAGDRLFSELERMGKRDLEERRISAYQERSVWPLLTAALAFLLRLVVGARRRPARAVAAAVLLVLLPLAGEARAGLRPPGGDELLRGREHYLAGDYEAALDALSSAVVAAPEDPLVSLAMGETLFRLERFEDAQREFARSLSLTEDRELRAEALFNAGTTRLATGELEEAISELRGSLRLDPGQEDALVNLELALRRLEQQQQEQQRQEQGDQDQQEQENPPRDQQQDEPQEQPPGEQEQQDQPQDQQQEPQEQPQDQPEEQQEQQDQEAAPEPQPETEEPEPQEQPPVEEMTPEQAEQLLKALDRDEEELKKSVQKRLRGGRATSGKRW